MSSATQAEFVTPSAIATRLGVRVDIVLTFIHSGELPAVDLSRRRQKPRWHVREEDLEAFLARRRSTPPAPPARKKRRLDDASIPEYYK